jgi:hypothetical protein
MAQKKIKRTRKATVRKRNTRLKTTKTHLAESALQNHLSWLRRRRLHTAIFEESWRNEKIANELAKRGAVTQEIEAFEQKRAELEERIEEVKKSLGWPDERLALFKQFVVQYRQEQSIENYVQIRRRFPEVEIQVSQFAGIEPLFALESELKRQGVDPDLVAAALDADEPSIDTLCLHLLELLIARSKLPKTGPGHIAMRRSAISDTTVNYLISTMLEAFDWHEERFRVPASLVVLVRHQLCGLKPDLHQEYLSREKRHNMAFVVAQQLKPDEKLSINKLVAMTGIPRSSAARWLADQEFRQLVEHGQRLIVDGLSKRPDSQ